MADEWIKRFETWFVDAARTCALMDASASPKTFADYFETRLRYVDYDPYQELAEKLKKENPKGPKVVSTAHDNSLALAPLHFVYMDVGCWAGSGEKDMWSRHREFGVVYGPIVVLCAFGKDAEYARYGKPPAWEAFETSGSTPTIDATIRRHPKDAVVAFLRTVFTICSRDWRLSSMDCPSTSSARPRWSPPTCQCRPAGRRIPSWCSSATCTHRW